MLPRTNPPARLNWAITAAVSTCSFLRRLLCSSEAAAIMLTLVTCPFVIPKRSRMQKKIKSELMRGLLPPGFECTPPSTLHARNNGTNITRPSESRTIRFRDHTWNGGKEHMKRPIQSPALNIRKWTALKSSGLDSAEYEGGWMECTAAVIAGNNASSVG